MSSRPGGGAGASSQSKVRPTRSQDVGVPCKPAASIEARRERTNTIQRNPAVCRSYTEDPTETRRQAHRAARVAADAKSTTPAATADAEPLDEPPVTRPGAFTFTGAP